MYRTLSRTSSSGISRPPSILESNEEDDEFKTPSRLFDENGAIFREEMPVELTLEDLEEIEQQNQLNRERVFEELTDTELMQDDSETMLMQDDSDEVISTRDEDSDIETGYNLSEDDVGMEDDVDVGMEDDVGTQENESYQIMPELSEEEIEYQTNEFLNAMQQQGII
jgi:hypothetical protein